MLKVKVIEKHKPSNKDLELFNSTKLNYTYTNGYTQVIERTNIKQVFPIVYKINDLIIYDFLYYIFCTYAIWVWKNRSSRKYGIYKERI